MGDEAYLVCPENHFVPMLRETYARELTGDRDVMTMQLMYEDGLYCLQCDKAYGLSKLNDPKKVEPTIISTSADISNVVQSE